MKHDFRQNSINKVFLINSFSTGIHYGIPSHHSLSLLHVHTTKKCTKKKNFICTTRFSFTFFNRWNEKQFDLGIVIHTVNFSAFPVFQWPMFDKLQLGTGVKVQSAIIHICYFPKKLNASFFGSFFSTHRIHSLYQFY